jgi:hypothetical protein
MGTVVIVGTHCCESGNWLLKHFWNNGDGSNCWSTLQQWEPMLLLGYIVAAVETEFVVGSENDLGSHRKDDLGNNCCLSYSFRVRVAKVYSSFEPWLSRKQPADVITCDVAWRTPLEFQCTPF